MEISRLSASGNGETTSRPFDGRASARAGRRCRRRPQGETLWAVLECYIRRVRGFRGQMPECRRGMTAQVVAVVVANGLVSRVEIQS